MNLLIYTIIFVTTIYVTLRRGPGGAFVYVFLPCLLTLWNVPGLSVSPLPDFSTITTLSYALVLGVFIGGNLPSIKWHFIDTLIVLSSVFVVITSYATEVLWTAVSATGDEFLRWMVPYFAARVAFQQPILRRHAALILAYIAMFVGFFALIEFRLSPYIVSRTLEGFNIIKVDNTQVYDRWMFFRAMVTAAHPIDLGNIGILGAAMIGVFSVTGGLSLYDRRIALGLAGCLAMVVCSISFSSFMGAMVGGLIFLSIRYLRGAELLLMPGVIVGFVILFFFTAYLLSVNLELFEVGEGDQLSGSFYTRALIAQRCWKFAQDAGLFGFGGTINRRELNLESVDNSYMLFILRRGWIYIALWFVLSMTLAWEGTRTLLGQSSWKMRMPVAAALAGIFGIMVSMFTVWFGFIYAVLWLALVATMVSMVQTAQASRSIPLPVSIPESRRVEVAHA